MDLQNKALLGTPGCCAESNVATLHNSDFSVRFKKHGNACCVVEVVDCKCSLVCVNCFEQMTAGNLKCSIPEG